MKTLLAFLAVVLSLSGCASVEGGYTTGIGSMTGMAAGAMAGANVGGSKSANVLGAIVGAGIGAKVGELAEREFNRKPTTAESFTCPPGFEKGQFVEPRMQDTRVCVLRPEFQATFTAFKCDAGTVPAMLMGNTQWCVPPQAVVYLERDTRRAGYAEMNPGMAEAYARGQAKAAARVQRDLEREAYKAGEAGTYRQNNYRRVGYGGATEADHLGFPAQPGTRWAFK